MPAEPERFAALFNTPTIEAIYALSPIEFEHFVAYILRRAGYDVKEVGPHFLRGVDLEMRIFGKTQVFGGVECKRYTPGQLVTAPVVKGIRGAPAVDRVSAKPFVITTSDFNEAAHQMAEVGNKRVHLINGNQLIRYIAYIRGSRYDDDNTIAPLSPEFFAGRGSIKSRTASVTKILAIANNKGGVGKTTTAYYLGAEIARTGKRVLLIDLDGQANLTERCLPEQVVKLNEEGEHFPNIAQYFAGERSLEELITSAETMPGVSLIPSDPFLMLRDLGGSGRPDVELRFVRDVQKLCAQPIASLGATPDWIIIDTPPSMSIFTRAGLAAAQYILAPVRPRRASLAGTRNMLRTVRTMNALMGTNAKFLGAAITHWDNLALSAFFVNTTLAQALTGFGGTVFSTKIPIDNQLDSLEPGAKTQGAKAYENLANEIVRNIDQPLSSFGDQREAVSLALKQREE